MCLSCLCPQWLCCTSIYVETTWFINTCPCSSTGFSNPLHHLATQICSWDRCKQNFTRSYQHLVQIFCILHLPLKLHLSLQQQILVFGICFGRARMFNFASQTLFPCGFALGISNALVGPRETVCLKSFDFGVTFKTCFFSVICSTDLITKSTLVPCRSNCYSELKIQV